MEITLDNLSFSYDQSEHTNIFHNASIVFSKGRISAVVGRSGSGKSTLLKLLTGLVGSEVHHRCISYGLDKLSPTQITEQGRLSLCLQKPACLPWASIYDNVTLAFRLQEKPIDDEKTMALLTLFGLAENCTKIYPNTLSIGMQARVALARAFVTSPDVVLLDEPFSSLDVVWKEELYNFLLNVLSVSKCTVVLVTHDLLEALCIADDIFAIAPNSKSLQLAKVANPLKNNKGKSSIEAMVGNDQFPKLFKEVCKALANPKTT